MTSALYRCPDCARLVRVEIHDTAGVRTPEFRDARNHPRHACDCGLPLREALAQRQLEPVERTTPMTLAGA